MTALLAACDSTGWPDVAIGSMITLGTLGYFAFVAWLMNR
jgi:hypothetical protein